MPSNRVLRVAADGSGEFRTVQEAIDAVPLSNRVRTVIQVAPGLYREPVYVPKTKNFITLAASRPETTILSWDNTATRINHHQVSRTSPPPGARTLIGTGTFGCGSTIVEGEDFIAENITFENKAPQFPVLKHRKNALGGTQVAAGFSLSSKPSTPQLGAAEGPLLLLCLLKSKIKTKLLILLEEDLFLWLKFAATGWKELLKFACCRILQLQRGCNLDEVAIEDISVVWRRDNAATRTGWL
ncbi:hypothetical protein BHE74_00026367 [Ensete ventricosum]|nr:hypothetical protein BHE74_00026367 [Ensete ventricosum]